MTTFASFAESIGVMDKAFISFVGAGGKTSLIKRLSWELFQMGKRVAVTTTTKMDANQSPQFWNASKVQNEEEIEETIRRSSGLGLVPFFYSAVEENDKLSGFSPDFTERIFKKVDYLLVEADGARGASFKVPRAHEPVLSEATTHLCIVMGCDIFESYPQEGLFFNFEELSKTPGFHRDEIVTPFTIRKLILMKDGYLRFARKDRKIFLVINKVDSASKMESMIQIAGEFYHCDFEKIILISREEGSPVISVDNSGDRVAGVILAAGKSERFGRQKLCEKIEGEAIIGRVVRQSLESKLDSVCVVLGYEAKQVRKCLDLLESHPALMWINNPNFERGMGSSISEAVSAVSSWADAVMIILGDMPAITTDIIDRVLEVYKKFKSKICYPVVEGRQGHPVIFRKELFPDLISLSGDTGAHKVIELNAEWAKVVEISNGRSQMDIDTAEDLEKFKSMI